jgi:hypothetical protein
MTQSVLFYGTDDMGEKKPRSLTCSSLYGTTDPPISAGGARFMPFFHVLEDNGIQTH